MKKLIAVVALLALGTFLGVGTAHAKTIKPKATAERVYTFAVAGDSTTALPNSWLYQWTDPQFVHTHGLAQSGWTSGQVLRSIKEDRANFVVIMLGVNDIRHDYTQHETLENLVAIANKVKAAHVIICAVTPTGITDATSVGGNDIDPQALQNALNAELPAFAGRHGYTFVDPAASIRQPDGSYVEGMNQDDGVHPSTAGFATMDAPIAATMREILGLS